MARPEPHADGDPMPDRWRRLLAFYLIGVGVLLVYLLVKLSGLEFPETPTILEPAGAVASPAFGGDAPAPGPSAASDAGAPPANAPSARAAPHLIRLFPVATMGSKPSLEVAIYGRHFQDASTVRFNGVARHGTRDPGTDILRAATEPQELIGIGSLSVDVVNPDGRISNALSILVLRPTASLSAFCTTWTVTREVQLLLLVLLAGGLGGFLHALKSLADFIGNRTLMSSWFWWYICRPFLGLALAFVFYAILRGGFLSGTSADARVVSPFGAIAVAALVGMFSDKAAQKLAEIFDTLFKAEDRRSGKMAAPIIDRLEPATVPPHDAREIEIVGERFGKITKVSVDGRDRKPTRVSERKLAFALDAADVAAPGTRQVTLSNDGDDGTASATLFVSDLAITTASLPAAAIGKPYAAPLLLAAGGKPSYSWSALRAPDGLKLTTKGEISGTPVAAGKYDVVVQVRDEAGATASKPFSLDVTP